MAAGCLFAAADRRRLGPRRRLGRQPLPAVAGPAAARDHPRSLREAADPDARRAAGGGGRRRQRMGAGASPALPAARTERRGAGRVALLPRRSLLGRRARGGRMDRGLHRIRPVGLAQRAQQHQALAEEPQDLAAARGCRRAGGRGGADTGAAQRAGARRNHCGAADPGDLAAGRRGARSRGQAQSGGQGRRAAGAAGRYRPQEPARTRLAGAGYRAR